MLCLKIRPPDWAEDQSRYVRRLLECHAFPGLGDLPVDDFRPPTWCGP